MGDEHDQFEDEARGYGPPFNAVSDKGIRALAQPCATCIFRADGPIGRDRVDQMVQVACARDSAIICHATLGLAEQMVCRGFRAARWRHRAAAAGRHVRLPRRDPATLEIGAHRRWQWRTARIPDDRRLRMAPVGLPPSDAAWLRQRRPPAQEQQQQTEHG